MSKNRISVNLLALAAATLVGCSPGQFGAPGVTSGSAETKTPSSVEADPDPCAVADRPSIESLMGRYEIMSFERFRGGLMSLDAAEQRIGAVMEIAPTSFRFEEKQFSSPRYEIVCHNDVPVEGEVPTHEARSLSSFYGVAIERDVVWVLTVRDSAGERQAGFEVVPGDGASEIWQLWDGWLFVLRQLEAEDAR